MKSSSLNSKCVPAKIGERSIEAAKSSSRASNRMIAKERIFSQIEPQAAQQKAAQRNRNEKEKGQCDQADTSGCSFVAHCLTQPF